ncbi:MAG TPA: xanthine dehydrogenase family protein molybdopterin-binding subunit [Nitrososphaerales archaeon]|nr:xanthine dehydrogenase family protein molybdopterin-binding subunit [Nitrososphaerales archaeon]
METQTVEVVEPESEEKYRYVGKGLSKVDAEEKVTGKAVYGVDFSLPHMLFGKMKRSEVPHAEIIKIDTAKASQVPGVRAILTGEDIPKTLFGAGLNDTPVLARGRVRYVGEPLAAVAADTLDAAAAAVDLIEVQYRELPTLFDPEEAMKAKPAVVIHPDLMTYKVSPKWPPVRDPALPNVCNHVKVRKGNVEEGFRKADKVIENRFTTNLVHHVHTEPNAALGRAENDGSVTIWTSTQSIYRVRFMLSEALQLPPSRVRVIATEVGGGFGNKLNSVSLEAMAVLLSKATGKPVKFQLTREEVFGATTTRHPFVIYVKDGVTKEGRVIARQIKAILDGGGYAAGSGTAVARNTIFSAATTYDIPNLWIDTYRVYTNKVPSGAFRGFGTTQMVWAVESQMDMISRTLGIGPVKLRLANLLREGGTSGLGEVVHGTNHAGVIQEAARMIGLESRTEMQPPWRTGKGVAVSEKYSGEPGASAGVRYRSDGMVDVFASVQEIGQGTKTGISQIAAESLKVPIETVKIVQADTFLTPYDSGAISSRQTFNIGNAVIAACEDLKKNIFETAARKTGIPAEKLEISDGYVLGPGGNKVKITDLFIRGKSRYGVFLDKGDEFWGYGTWIVDTGEIDPETGQATLPRLNTAYTSCAWGAEVAVNTETGETRVVRTVVVADAGRIVNPKLAEGQMEGAVSQGISTSMYEELVLEKGKPVNPDFKDYKLLNMYNATPIEVKFIGLPSTDGPYGAKPLGEAGIIGIGSAIANAIFDAVGARILDLPITSERVLKGIKSVKS